MTIATERAPARGRLLVAAPSLQDPNFARTVVLLLEHNEGGTLGVVLNRPTDQDLSAVLPQWELFAAQPAALFRGGPVDPDAAVCLGTTTGAAVAGWQGVLGALGVVDLSQDPDELAGRIAAVRVFVGYAGWGPGQLDVELDEGAWFVVDAEAADVFAVAPERLWSQVLRRQPGDLALLATFPADPSLN